MSHRTSWFTLALGMLAAAAVVGVPLIAQQQAQTPLDLSGEWAAIRQEDQPHRVPGPELGDYTGLPINAADRQKAETWDASTLSEPERQAQPHPAQYSMRGGGGPNLRWSKMYAPVTGDLIGYSIVGLYGRADRRIWLDGRNHPSDYSEHTWDGYSTGVQQGNALFVTTTHMKTGVIQRNGAATSSYGVMREGWFRHGDYLIVMTLIDDPIYLEEPFVRTTEWVRDTAANISLQQFFESVDELGDKPAGWVPHWPLGTHHTEYGKNYGIPFEATQGGAESMYPEYQLKIDQWKKGASK
jgi:hypothetical protein